MPAKNTADLHTLIDRLYTNNPDLDLMVMKLNDPTQVEQLNWKGLVRQKANILPELKSLQRLQWLAGDKLTATVLHMEGMASAQQVAAMPRSRFLQQFTPLLGENGEARAEQLYKRAGQIQRNVMHLYANVHSVVGSKHTRHLPVTSISDDVREHFQNLSSYQEIFGSLDYCNCSECQSIYGPAAYLVDLLRIIHNAITVPNTTRTNSKNNIPKGLTLDERRRDLARIPLTCEMTNDEVPYLQIVNEILEQTVASSLKLSEDDDTFRYLASKLYYPFNLPFNLPLEQIRTYLKYNDQSLPNIFQAFAKSTRTTLPAAREELQLSVRELNNLKPPTGELSAVLSANYGLPEEDLLKLARLDDFMGQTGLSLPEMRALLTQQLSAKELFDVSGDYDTTIFEVESLSLIQTGNQVSSVEDASTFHVQGTIIENVLKGRWKDSDSTPTSSGIFELTFSWDGKEFDGFLRNGFAPNTKKIPWTGSRKDPNSFTGGKLPNTFFINKPLASPQYLAIRTQNPNKGESYEEIVNIKLQTLDTLNRFIRLAAKLGWSYAELNWVMTSHGITELNDEAFIKIAQTKVLAEESALDLQLLTSLWYDIKTMGVGNGPVSKAPFDQIFNSPELLKQYPKFGYYHPKMKKDDADFINPLYQSKVLEWNLTKESPIGYANLIVDALSASKDDIETIAQALYGLKPITLQLNMHTLSALYRHSALPKALNIAVPDYIVLLKLLGFTTEKKNKSDNAPGLQDTILPRLTIEQVTQLTKTLVWLRKVQLNPYQIDFICEGVSSVFVNTGYSEDRLPAFLQALATVMEPVMLNPLSFIMQGLINEKQSKDVFALLLKDEFIDIKGILIKDVYLEQPKFPTQHYTAEQIAFLNDKLETTQNEQRKKLAEQLAEFFGVKADLLELLLSSLSQLLKLPNYVALFVDQTAHFSAPLSNGASTSLPDDLLNFIRWTARFLKLTQLLSLHPAQISVLFQLPAAFGIKDLKLLSIHDLINIDSFNELEIQFGDKKGRLLTYFELAWAKEADRDAMLESLYLLTGWEKEQISTLCNSFFGGITACKSVLNIRSLKRVFDSSQKLGVTVNFLQELNKLDELEADFENQDDWQTFIDLAKRSMQAIKSQTTAVAWPTVFGKLMSPINETTRNVLETVAVWKLGEEDFSDIQNSRDLYEFLLLDVDMSGCATISYIKQALNSAQLYLQRCRLNLELNVSISPNDLPHIWWEWLMHFRVWQANRKVFLYPENYIDPSLRPGKTSLFTSLENTLRQGPVTQDKVAIAYTHYLDQLADLSKLVYVDGYNCKITSTIGEESNNLFLFARNQTEPSKFYYITQDVELDQWSEWKEINITINAEYLTPVYAFNKLFIFWVELKHSNVTSQIKLSETEVTNTKDSVYKATIKYSFYNFSGDWVQPQTLEADIIANYIPAEKSIYAPIKEEVFDMNRQYWKKVAAFTTSEANFAQGATLTASDTTTKQQERISVIYGPILDPRDFNGTTLVKSLKDEPPSGTSIADKIAFKNLIKAAVVNKNILLSLGKESRFPLIPTRTVSMDLTQSFLIYKKEFIGLESYVSADSAPTFRAGITQLDNSEASLALAINQELNPMYANFTDGMKLSTIDIQAPDQQITEGSFVYKMLDIDNEQSKKIFALAGENELIDTDGKVVPAKAIVPFENYKALFHPLNLNDAQIRHVRNTIFVFYYGTPIYFSNVSPKSTSLFTIKNQPAWLVFNNQSESFLIYYYDCSKNSLCKQFDTFSQGNVVEYTVSTLISKESFISLLLTYPKEDWTLKPQVSAAEEDISKAAEGLSEEIYNSLVYYEVLKSNDGGGHAYPILSKARNATIEQFMHWSEPVLSYTIAKGVKQVILGPTEIVYKRQAVDSNLNINTLQLNVTRLTTNAVNQLSRRLFTGGIEQLLTLEAQQAPRTLRMSYEDLAPNDRYLSPPSTLYGEQVSFDGPYGQYYWELFFHGPLLVAQMLNQNQQFREAQQWLHYIFNPTIPPLVVSAKSFASADIGTDKLGDVFNALEAAGYIKDGTVTKTGNEAILADIRTKLEPSWPNIPDLAVRSVQNSLRNNYLTTSTTRYWNFLPFRNHTLESLKEQLTNSSEIKAYENDPFNPQAIAHLRIGAYEKAVVMQYIKNLLDWGDYEFSQYTWESITTATMLYVYAYDLLGPQPIDLGSCDQQFPATFEDILSTYPNGIPQFFIDLENTLGGLPFQLDKLSDAQRPFNELQAYFCVPENSLFMNYWDRVQDRLYKIRHCLNIQGQAQPLPLFAPPINPMALVRAAAASNNVMNVMAQLQPQIPLYRFERMLAQAKNTTSTLMQFGSALLSALEKNDVEQLAVMKTNHTGVLLNMSTLLKKKKIEDLEKQLSTLNIGLQNAQYRESYFKQLADQNMNGYEIAALSLNSLALAPKAVALGFHLASMIPYSMPVIFGFSNGGMKFGDVVQAAAQALNMEADILNNIAGIVATRGQYARRQEEWRYQEKIAQFDQAQIDEQISGLKVQIEMAEQDLAIHLTSIQQLEEEEQFLQRKFTNQELYLWMLGRLSSLYFQTYRLCLDLALAAQTCYNFELDRDDAIINFGYWDNLYKGLLAGESLMSSLHQLEKAFLDNNTRRLEIEKTVSIRQIDPVAFLKFKWGENGGTKGQLEFTLSEKLFDFDFPGHYARKIKSVSISIPAVIGPYQNINATLMQSSNWVLLKPDKDAVKYLVDITAQGQTLGNVPASPPASVLRTNWVPDQQVAITKGIDDSGLFVLNFQDERYLPFEGTGAVSKWILSIPPKTNRIDFNSISDVIVKIQYTAEDGGQTFRKDVMDIYDGSEEQFKNVQLHLFNLKQNFSSAWEKMMTLPPQDREQHMQFSVTPSLILPNLVDIELDKAMVQLEVVDDAGEPVSIDDSSDFLELSISGTDKSKKFSIDKNFGVVEGSELTDDTFIGNWTLSFDLATEEFPDQLLDSNKDRLDPNKLRNIALVIMYQAAAF